MKRVLTPVLLALTLSACSGTTLPGTAYSNDSGVADASRTCALSQHFTLTVNNGVGASSVIVNLLTDEFSTNYPKLACYLNGGSPAAHADVTLNLHAFDPGDTRAAYASGRDVHISATWLRDHPLERGVLTHELAHVVQNYDSSAAEGWLVEGMADYLRYLYTPLNPAWNLLPITDRSVSYRLGYATAARFLLWMEKVKSPGFVRALNDAIRQGQTTGPSFFQARTGRTLDDLWAEYLNAGLF